MKKFLNKYSVSKTLRFELKPVGQTLQNIQEKGLLSKDETLALNYTIAKKIIDDYHRYFIEKSLSKVSLDMALLNDFHEVYHRLKKQKTEKNQEKKLKELQDELQKIQENLRKQIVKGFKSQTEYKKLFSEKLIKDLIIKWLENKLDSYSEKEKEALSSFKNFTTYFVGFHKNRKNIYTDEEIHTAIAYRLIHENLPKFLDNVNTYTKVKEKLGQEKLTEIEQELKFILKGTTLDKVFTLDYYSHLLTQKGIDFFNSIIGGYTDEQTQKKIQGLNEYINLYNQQQKDKKDRVPKIKPLYKQILSDKKSISFLPAKFDSSQEVLNAIRDYYIANLISYSHEDSQSAENVLEKIKEYLFDLSKYDLSKIHLKNTSITNISNALFSDWNIIPSALRYYATQNILMNKTKLSEDDEKQIEKYLKQNYFSIQEIETALWAFKEKNDVLKEYLEKHSHPIVNYFKEHFISKQNENIDKKFDFIANITAKYKCIEGLLNTEYSKDKPLYQEKDHVRNLKLFLDTIMEYLHFVKPLMAVTTENIEKDEDFYSFVEPYYQQLKAVVRLYDKVRNYATQKPYSEQKIKLNFENSTLLAGWDVNKEEANICVLLLKDNQFYLGIMDKKHNKIFREKTLPKAVSEHRYQKMIYKSIADPVKDLPRIFFSKKDKKLFNPDEEILRIRNYATHTKNGDPQEGFTKGEFNIQDCRKMIDFFKQSIEKHPKWKDYFNFVFSPTHTYNSINEFYREVEHQGYAITYTEIDEEVIHQFVSEGKLYLFQIYNKDFSSCSKGNPNLHTLYWKALFDPENLKNVFYRLNGKAEVFYRKKSISESNKIIHKAHQPIANKNPNNPKKQSTFEYDLVKDKHYTEDKFFFHVPITLNFKAEYSSNKKVNINKDVLQYLKENEDINIIGIDRGERHLIYVTVINLKGEILHQESLNTIENKAHNLTTNYHELLDKKEEEREYARKEWGIIQNIKELKEGYISQVVHKVVQLMLQYNAIVVLEDLNSGFKRTRIKVEKQVYQKFEKMLIDKLNYLIFKNKPHNEPGGLYKALQLTNPFESFEKMGKQNGFLFYIPAWNTSKIDPTTGFVNLFGNIKYESVKDSKEFFEKFKSIKYNSEQGYFEFEFNYNEFTNKCKNSRTEWTVCTFGNRIKTFRSPKNNNQWYNEKINITQKFKEMFDKYKITYQNGKCIKSQIQEQDNKNFFMEMMELFKLTLQMRNSIIERDNDKNDTQKADNSLPKDADANSAYHIAKTDRDSDRDRDYIISPVLNDKKQFFDTRNADNSLPKDADANGAYHIAKKGLMCIQQLKQSDKDLDKFKFDVSNETWLGFVQKKQ